MKHRNWYDDDKYTDTLSLHVERELGLHLFNSLCDTAGFRSAIRRFSFFVVKE